MVAFTKQGKLNEAFEKAAEKNDTEAGLEALRNGANPADAKTGIFYAILNQNIDLFRQAVITKSGTLLNTEIRTRGDRIQTPLELAVQYNFIDAVRLLAEQDKTLLEKRGQVRVVKGNNTVWQYCQNTPLETAEKNNQIEVSYIIASEMARRMQARTDVLHAKAKTYETALKAQGQKHEDVKNTVNNALGRNGKFAI